MHGKTLCSYNSRLLLMLGLYFYVPDVHRQTQNRAPSCRSDCPGNWAYRFRRHGVPLSVKTIPTYARFRDKNGSHLSWDGGDDGVSAGGFHLNTLYRFACIKQLLALNALHQSHKCSHKHTHRAPARIKTPFPRDTRQANREACVTAWKGSEKRIPISCLVAARPLSVAAP